jgi:hypothetical protein
MLCKICGETAQEQFKAKILKKYNISYFYCNNRGFLQTEELYWIQEAYKNPINKSDTGYPFGGEKEIGLREFEIIKGLGVKTVTTSKHGTIYKEHVNHLECLSKIMLTENFYLKNTSNVR